MIPLYAKTRFGKWDEILQEKQPQLDRQFCTGIWHYAHGLAFIAKGQFVSAQDELARLQALASNPAITRLEVGSTTVGNLFRIVSSGLAGELAAKQRNYDKAISQLTLAVLLQDGLPYTEPPDWYYPVSQSLGAVLLEAGYPAGGGDRLLGGSEAES